MPTTRRCGGRSPFRRASLLQLGGTAPNFALNPNLPDIADAVQQQECGAGGERGHAAAAPTTRAQYQAGATVPTNLFSHTDQQLEWQNAAQSGVHADRVGGADRGHS